MNDKDFQKLVQSVKQMGTIIQGVKPAHRRTTLTDLNVKELRERTGLTNSPKEPSLPPNQHVVQ